MDEDGTWDVQDVKAEAEASGSRLADESVAAGSVWRDKEWGPGEYDEDLIREQVSLLHVHAECGARLRRPM